MRIAALGISLALLARPVSASLVTLNYAGQFYGLEGSLNPVTFWMTIDDTAKEPDSGVRFYSIDDAVIGEGLTIESLEYRLLSGAGINALAPFAVGGRLRGGAFESCGYSPTPVPCRLLTDLRSGVSAAPR